MSRFAIMPAAAVTDTRLSTRDLSVLAAIGVHTDRNGWCYPSLGRLGDMLGISRQAVQKSMRVLTAAGYVQAVARAREDGGQASNRMRVLFDTEHPQGAMRVAPPATPEVAPPATVEVAPPATPGVAQNDPSNAPPERQKPARVRAPAVDLPEWLDPQAWADFSEHRRKIRAPLTEHAAKLALGELAKLREQGHQPAAVINQSILNGWRGLFALKDQHHDRTPAHRGARRESEAERVERINREHDERELAGGALF